MSDATALLAELQAIDEQIRKLTEQRRALHRKIMSPPRARGAGRALLTKACVHATESEPICARCTRKRLQVSAYYFRKKAEQAAVERAPLRPVRLNWAAPVFHPDEERSNG